MLCYCGGRSGPCSVLGAGGFSSLGAWVGTTMGRMGTTGIEEVVVVFAETELARGGGAVSHVLTTGAVVRGAGRSENRFDCPSGGTPLAAGLVATVSPSFAGLW